MACQTAVGNLGPILGVQFLRDCLNFAEDAQPVAAQNLAAVFSKVAAIKQRLQNSAGKATNSIVTGRRARIGLA